MEIQAVSSPHVPVMLREVIEALDLGPGARVLDGTLGGGGHSAAILERVPQSEICAIDRDMQAIEVARNRLRHFDGRIHIFHDTYANFDAVLDESGWNTINGAMLDLGVSSIQIDSPGRGFSFLHAGPLDMRMDQSDEKSARQFVNRASFDELKECISIYGEEPNAGRIARLIVDERQKRPIEDTETLARLVCRAYPAAWRGKSRKHPATRTFQALRMAVNGELEQLRMFFAKILPRMAPGGRIAVISFHSLEDRIVKNAMRDWARNCICPPTQQQCTCGHEPEVEILYKKPLIPSQAEIKANPRAGSAKLRAARKLVGSK